LGAGRLIISACERPIFPCGQTLTQQAGASFLEFAPSCELPHLGVRTLELAAGGVNVRTVAGAGSFQPRVIADRLAEIDLGQGIVMDLSAGDLRAIAARHEGDLFFLAIGGGDQSIFGDLKVAAAFDPCFGRRRQ
jgi:hypothetical protein